ncbi:TolC family protein [Dickeya zeae]|uniref:Outer membrane efflux protein n=1 Tax=Dickeya zeae (strain Ech586) TaxID=590409 RepID=D2C165_DICZ5|nr:MULTISPECIES: TolC family protein [Dickeya]ACZ75026.1 outer membrane efflux protein [Dickeya parazeae Ech586]UCZ77034.1 TolC family protein [Dickeya zeae]
MNKVLFCLWLLMLFGACARADTRLTPSQPTRSGASSPATARVSLNEQTIDLTLSDAIYLGLRDNRAIRSAYLYRVAQKFDLRVAEDRFTPKLVLSSSYLSTRNQSDRYRQGNLTPTSTLLTPYGTRVSLGWAYRRTDANVAGVSRNDGVNLSVIQPLLRGAGRDVATAPVRQARLAEQMNRLSLKSTVSQTITQIITAYRELLRAQEQVQIARDALARARQLVEVNRAMIAAGRMAEFEIVQTEAEVANQELGYEDARNQLDTTRLALLQLLALNLDTPIVATEAMQASRVDVNAAQALGQAESLQPAYLSHLIASEQAQINLTVARNDQLWDVSLVGGTNQVNDRNTQSGNARTWENYVGVQVDIPIGDLSRRQAEVQAQVGVRDQALQLAEARQQLERDVTNAVRDIGVRWRQFEIAQRARDLSRRKLDIEREKLAVGRSSNFQVLSFENDLRNAENARLNALIGYMNAQAVLDEALGTTLESWDIALND